MEFSDKEDLKEEKVKVDKKQIFFLILIVIFILLLSFTIFYLMKNKDVIAANPISYGMKLYNFTSCSCLTNGKMVSFGG